MTKRYPVLLTAVAVVLGACSSDPQANGTPNSTVADGGPDIGVDAAAQIDQGASDARPSDASGVDDASDTSATTDATRPDSGPAADASTPDAGSDASTDSGSTDDVGDAGQAADAGFDAGVDAGVDAGSDAGPDARVDAGADAGPDTGGDAGSCPDSDGDGYFDIACGGTDCDDGVATINPGATEACGDGVDNDCDATTVDLFDDDGDGFACDVDCDDATAAMNPGAAEVCDDGLDNDCDAGTPDLFDEDGDGHTCDADCDDTAPAINPDAIEICDNVTDDDCDGLADMQDADCMPMAEVCDNGVDDDLDTAVDCADTDCAAATACAGNACPNPVIVASSKVTWVVDTTTFTDDSAGSCGTQSGVDAVFEITLPADSDVHVDTEGTPFDTLLYVRQTNCDSGSETVCDSDVNDYEEWARLDMHALPAGTYYVFADADGSGTGDLTVNFSITGVSPRSLVAVDADPLLRMPGTQPDSSMSLEGPDRCLNCHEEKNGQPLLGAEWKGSMMAQAGRDPIFWAAMTVAAQDSIWVLGNANATDLCERCHFPAGWLEERSEPTNASAMTSSDFDGVHCDVCHQLVDPFATATAAGTREGSDWSGYWDEQNAVSPDSGTRAATTLAQDRLLFAGITLFNGDPFYDGSTWLPDLQTYVENGSGQMFVANNGPKRGPYADDTANHQTLYSRYHKSRYFCQTCHDVSNPALANLGAPAGQPLPSETDPAFSYFHVERTFSEFMLSDFAQQGGAAGTGAFAPANFDTRHQGDVIASCQDCHMPQSVGVAVDKNSAKTRPTDSTEHIRHGVGSHAMVGGNAWVPRILASTVNGSPNYDATNANLLGQGPGLLTLDLSQGLDLDPDALLSVASEAEAQLQRAASIESASYDSSSGALTFRVVNHTGHKLISGFPEGRRMWVNVVVRDGGGNVLEEVNPYDFTVGTLKGLDPAHAPSSPALGTAERHEDLLVYEMNPSSTLTGESKTFHFVLADGRYKDNRIPPRGFDIAEAPSRLSEPVIAGQSAPGYFTSAEYTGGYDEVSLTVASGGADVEVTLYYQTTSREYVEFLRDQINGDGTSLYSETPAGAAIAYVAQTDPFFSGLAAWGDTMWQLWEHNKDLAGAAPIEMTSVTLP